MTSVLPYTADLSSGSLTLGGCAAGDLVSRFGTPLVVFDRRTFEDRITSFAAAIERDRIFYAAKAFCCVAICELLERMRLGLDVCTGGELATALEAGFDPARIVFHGNNKSAVELDVAKDAGVGRLVLDSFDEIGRVSDMGWEGDLLLRVTPGVEAHTHEFVQTGQEDSKFGFGLGEGVALEGVKRALEIRGGRLIGIHAHIGSQIFEMAAFELAAERLAAFAAEARAETGFEPEEVNLGGGLGIAHTSDEMTPDPGEAVARIIASVRSEFERAGLTEPRVCVEPGRALVGPAAVTLYEVGTVKRIPGVRTFVAVDGGMSDNIRPALYGARYEAFLANRPEAPPGPRVTVVGKHCESGDVLIKDVHLPDDVAPGDLLCIPATGAYTYSMASNYNRVPRPAVVMVEDGRATAIVARETDHDLLRLDRRLDGSEVRTP